MNPMLQVIEQHPQIHCRPVHVVFRWGRRGSKYTFQK